jgi:hypothetical protein
MRVANKEQKLRMMADKKIQKKVANKELQLFLVAGKDFFFHIFILINSHVVF